MFVALWVPPVWVCCKGSLTAAYGWVTVDPRFGMTLENYDAYRCVEVQEKRVMYLYKSSLGVHAFPFIGREAHAEIPRSGEGSAHQRANVRGGSRVRLAIPGMHIHASCHCMQQIHKLACPQLVPQPAPPGPFGLATATSTSRTRNCRSGVCIWSLFY